jgi:hypothetical protein
LKAPWPGPALPAGTPLRNARTYGTYTYCLFATVDPGHPVLSGWTDVSCTVNGVGQPDWPMNQWLSPAVTQVKFALVLNQSNPTGSMMRWKDAALIDLT